MRCLKQISSIYRSFKFICNEKFESISRQNFDSRQFFLPAEILLLIFQILYVTINYQILQPIRLISNSFKRIAYVLSECFFCTAFILFDTCFLFYSAFGILKISNCAFYEASFAWRSCA